jgi:hypothetical protein
LIPFVFAAAGNNKALCIALYRRLLAFCFTRLQVFCCVYVVTLLRLAALLLAGSRLELGRYLHRESFCGW